MGVDVWNIVVMCHLEGFVVKSFHFCIFKIRNMLKDMFVFNQMRIEEGVIKFPEINSRGVEVSCFV